jgi:hypothetical protein
VAIHARGHGGIALLLAPLTLAILWRLRRDPMAGALLRWRKGCWTLQHAASLRIIDPTARSTATQWVVYLAFNDAAAGRSGHFWLYPDSVSREQWRRLRVRVNLL